jgi:hypothetical protein
MKISHSILAGCLALAMPAALAHADDVKVHAPNAYLESEALKQLEAVLSADPTLSWRKDAAGNTQKLLTITKSTDSTVHVWAGIYFKETRPIFGLGPVTGSGVPMITEGPVDVDFDVKIKCTAAPARDYSITTNGSLSVIVELKGLRLHAPDEARLQDDLEARLSGLPRQVNDILWEGTVAMGVPSEVMCKSVFLNASADIDLGFELGQCLAGDTKHSACSPGAQGDGMDFECRDHVWFMSRHDCRAIPSHDPNANEHQNNNSGANPGHNGGGSNHKEP